MADGSIDTRTAHISAEEALAMHASGRPGKLETRISKPITTARDLSLAYSPGVAEPCLHIAARCLDSPTTTPPRATWWR